MSPIRHPGVPSAIGSWRGSGGQIDPDIIRQLISVGGYIVPIPGNPEPPGPPVIGFYYLAELPRINVDQTFTLPGGPEYRVATSGLMSDGGTPTHSTIQDALNADKDAGGAGVIRFKKNDTFLGTSTLRAKGGTVYTYVMPDDYTTMPAPGGRIRVSAPSGGTVVSTSNMPRLLCPAEGGTVQPSIVGEAGACYYRLFGLNFESVNNGAATIYGFAQFPQSGPTLCNHIIFDRCRFYAYDGLQAVRAISLNGDYMAVIGCEVSNFIDEIVRYDCQAVFTGEGKGHLLYNNFFEAIGENYMSGGDDTLYEDRHPQDVTIQRNWFLKRPSWQSAILTKNLIEFKKMKRALVEGNVFENNWTGAQDGLSMLLTVRNQYGSNPWAAVQDIIFRYNKFIGIESGFNIIRADYTHSSQTTSRVVIRNNLLVPRQRNLVLGGGDGIDISHNTMLGPASIIVFTGISNTFNGFRFDDNLCNHGEYGVVSENGGDPGQVQINNYAPGASFARNLFYNGQRFSYGIYPAGTMYESTAAGVGFENYAGGNFKLAAGSPYKGVAPGGLDPGCDIDGLEAMIAGVK